MPGRLTELMEIETLPANIFDACARRCPDCRCTTFYGRAGSPFLKCADCERLWLEGELTEPDWKRPDFKGFEGEGREPDNDDPIQSVEFL